jgi:hypothetical protein
MRDDNMEDASARRARTLVIHLAPHVISRPRLRAAQCAMITWRIRLPGARTLVTHLAPQTANENTRALMSRRRGVMMHASIN